MNGVFLSGFTRRFNPPYPPFDGVTVGGSSCNRQVVEGLCCDRERSVGSRYKKNASSATRQFQGAGHDAWMLEMKKRQCRNHADSNVAPHHSHHCRKVLDLQHRVHLQGMKQRVEMLTNAARFAQVHEGMVEQVARLEHLLSGELMILPTHQVEIVRTKKPGAQLG